MITVIIPANNEQAYIGPCLAALGAQADARMLVIVSANACSDQTVEISETFRAGFEAEGHDLQVIDSPVPGKLAALDRAEAAIPSAWQSAPRMYLDADVVCDPELVAQIANALDTDQPRYATGTLQVAPAKTAFTRAYARLWQRLPFVEGGAVGAGCFAVNAAGRKRWNMFPQIISDDTFVRLNFTPDERIEVPARYHWPMIEGMAGLVKVRRRQDAGVAELERLYPDLIANEGKAALTKGRLMTLAVTQPLDFAAYMAVHLAVKAKRGDASWTRGR